MKNKKNNPFILWDNYNATNKNAFFGREKEISQLEKKLANNIVIFYGPSGAGKSSICKAGLEPDVYIEDYTHDYLEKRTGLKNADYIKFLQTTKSLKRPVIALDQFEKIFYDPAANVQFVKYVVNDFLENRDFKLLIIIREESIGELFKFSAKNNFSLLSDETGFHLYKMERSNVIDVFIKIFKSAGVKISQGFATTVIDTLEKATGKIELADVQAVGYELFHENNEDEINEITSQEVYNKIDGFYDRLYENLTETQKRVLKKGISSTGERTRICNYKENLHEINFLVTSRILKKVGDCYEIAHEYLVKKLLSGLSKQELELIRVRELVERATQDFSYNPDLYLDLIRLNEINKHKVKLELNLDETELVTKSELKNDFSKENRQYWIKKLSDFFPECMDFFISYLEQSVVDSLSKQSENQSMIVSVFKDLFEKGKMNYEQFFNALKYGLLSNNREVAIKSAQVLPEINGYSINTLLTLIEISPYYLFPELYKNLYSKPGSGLLTEKIIEWSLSEEKDKVKHAYGYLKANNVTPDEVSISFPTKQERRYLEHISYLAYNGEFEFEHFDEILKRLFSFDNTLLNYVKSKAQKDNALKKEIFKSIANGTYAPFNVVFKKSQDFLDYENYASKKKIKITFIRKGVLDIKNFKSFALLSFNERNPDVYKANFDITLAILGDQSRYVIDFSTLDITGFDVTIGLMRSMSKIGKGINVFSCCLTKQGIKKIERFAHFARSLDIFWYI